MSDADRTRGQIHQIRGGKDGFFPPDGPARRLAAILAADISGYSRLMGIDEEGTYARVMRQRRELIEPTIAEHHGKLIKYTGDGFFGDVRQSRRGRPLRYRHPTKHGGT